MDFLKQASLTLRSIKVERFLGSLFYSYERDRLERQRVKPKTSTFSQSPEKCFQAESIPQGGHFQFKQLELEIKFLAPDLVQIDWKSPVSPLPYGIVTQDWLGDRTSSAPIIVREFLQLRYRLLPYFYTLAWEANQTGSPLIRPLFWLDNEDRKLWDVKDSFLVGNALMVCPILKPETRSRRVLLPKGYWYHFWDDQVLKSNDEIDLDAPLKQIPLLVRAGSILPMETGQRLILHIYPPIEGSSESYLYSDAKDGYGEWRLDTFTLVREDQGLELTRSEQGEYHFPYLEIELYLHGMKLQQAWVDGEKITDFSPEKLVCSLFNKVRLIGELINVGS